MSDSDNSRDEKNVVNPQLSPDYSIIFLRLRKRSFRKKYNKGNISFTNSYDYG